MHAPYSGNSYYMLYIFSDMAKHKLRFVSCDLRVLIYGLQVRSHKFRVKSHELRVQINKLRVQILELGVESHEFKFTSGNKKYKPIKIKNTSSELKAQVENSHPKSYRSENSHQWNSFQVIPPLNRKIPTQKIPTWKFPTHVFKNSHPLFYFFCLLISFTVSNFWPQL